MEKKEILHPHLDNPLPRPIPAKQCSCGCGYWFQPKRKDNIYLNKQHADFAYNNQKRKPKNKNRTIVEKVLLKNDLLLEKYYKNGDKSNEVINYLEILKADGFNFSYQIGITEKDEEMYYYTYNYFYCVFLENNLKMVKIYKR